MNKIAKYADMLLIALGAVLCTPALVELGLFGAFLGFGAVLIALGLYRGL